MTRSSYVLLALAVTTTAGVLVSSCNTPTCGPGTVQRQSASGELQCVLVDVPQQQAAGPMLLQIENLARHVNPCAKRSSPGQMQGDAHGRHFLTERCGCNMKNADHGQHKKKALRGRKLVPV